MKNIHVLPTDKQSRLYHWKGNDIYNSQFRLRQIADFCDANKSDTINQHIYITSDEEIKDNDYITDGYLVWKWKDDSSLLGRKKIILTTDQDLIKDGVQEIPDEFLEWFVKNPSCEFVEVTEYLDGGFSYGYKIIIPKEELFIEYTNTNDFTSMIYNSKEEPKQETLEEVLGSSKCQFSVIENKLATLYRNQVKIYNAITKQEQMYSEEEVIYLLYSLKNYLGFGEEVKEQEWFKQFKKK